MLKKTETDNFVRSLLGISKTDKLDYELVEIKSNRLYYNNELIRDDLNDLDAETLSVIVGEKTKFRCLYADQLECKRFLKRAGLNEEQIKTVIEENNIKKRNNLFMEFIQKYEQDLQNRFKSTLVPQRSLYHSIRKPVRITADYYIDCDACSSKVEENCDTIKAFNAKGEETMTLLQKIRNLIRLDNHEKFGEISEKIINRAIKKGWLKHKDIDDFI